MDEMKIGELRAEVLTAMVRTAHGPLFLTRTMPGRWLIQAGGSEDAQGQVWDGREFCPVLRPSGTLRMSVLEEGLEDALSKALDALKTERAVSADGRTVPDGEE